MDFDEAEQKGADCAIAMTGSQLKAGQRQINEGKAFEQEEMQQILCFDVAKNPLPREAFANAYVEEFHKLIWENWDALQEKMLNIERSLAAAPIPSGKARPPAAISGLSLDKKFNYPPSLAVNEVDSVVVRICEHGNDCNHY